MAMSDNESDDVFAAFLQPRVVWKDHIDAGHSGIRKHNPEVNQEQLSFDLNTRGVTTYFPEATKERDPYIG